MRPAPNDILKYVHKHGKLYTPAVPPSDMPRGEVGDCFDHCVGIALGKKYHYVEGIAKHPQEPDTWIVHAWLTDESGKLAYDPTWRAYHQEKEMPVPTTYLGIEMAIEDVCRFMISTRYKSVLCNAWRDPQAAEACAPGVPITRN